MKKLLFALMLLYSAANADDIFKGVRGPTKVQADERVMLSGSNGVETLANTLLLKYWDGKELGLFGYGAMSYKSNKNVSGFSDLTLAAGPRFTIGNFNSIDYAAVVLPIGSEGISNERTDMKIGSFNTMLSQDNSYGIDAVVEYTITGANNKGANLPNELYSSLMIEGKLDDNLRAAAGMTRLDKDDGKNLVNVRAILRYIPGKTWHAELVLDKTLHSFSIPQTTNAAIFVRYNL
jgi:hypothetical protein